MTRIRPASELSRRHVTFFAGAGCSFATGRTFRFTLRLRVLGGAGLSAISPTAGGAGGKVIILLGGSVSVLRNRRRERAHAKLPLPSIRVRSFRHRSVCRRTTQQRRKARQPCAILFRRRVSPIAPTLYAGRDTSRIAIHPRHDFNPLATWEASRHITWRTAAVRSLLSAGRNVSTAE